MAEHLSCAQLLMNGIALIIKKVTWHKGLAIDDFKKGENLKTRRCPKTPAGYLHMDTLSLIRGLLPPVPPLWGLAKMEIWSSVMLQPEKLAVPFTCSQELAINETEPSE